VQQVYSLGETSSDLVLFIAASLEQQSEHPLAKAQAQGMELGTPEILRLSLD
jgi:cation transport ATPase